MFQNLILKINLIRGAIKLELRCPQIVDGIAADPEPDWSFDALLSELNALENNLTSSKTPLPFTKIQQSRLVSFSVIQNNFKVLYFLFIYFFE